MLLDLWLGTGLVYFSALPAPSFTKYLNARCLAACKMKTIKSILNLIFFHFPIHEKLYILRCDKKITTKIIECASSDVPKKPRAKPKIKKERKLSKDAENTTCDVCNKKFSKRQYMKEHKRIHTGEKPFSCDICQKSFTHYTTFKEHKKSHTEGKTFSCETCGRAFQRKSQLIEHERIHTGEKPYSCELCNTSYASQSNLYHHNKTEGHIKRMNEAKDEDTSDYY